MDAGGRWREKNQRRKKVWKEERESDRMEEEEDRCTGEGGLFISG